jgi:thymidine kinase
MSLHMIIGNMGSGKTTELILRALDVIKKNDRLETPKKIALIKYRDDNRYGDPTYISTHNAVLQIKATHVVLNLSEITDLNSYDSIFIEEAHFYDDLIQVVKKLITDTTTEIHFTTVNGYTGDAKMTPACVSSLIPYASDVKVIKGICHNCRNDSIFTETTEYGDEQHKKGIYVGGFDMYRSLCKKCRHIKFK